MKRGLIILACIGLLSAGTAAQVDLAPQQPPPAAASDAAPGGQATTQAVELTLPELGDRGQAASTVQWLVLVTVMSLAPALLVMVTSFTRIAVVLGLLRQALATQNLPPNSVLMGLALLMTVVVMAPVFQAVHDDALGPYLAGTMDQQSAIDAGMGHVRSFMIAQMTDRGNTDEVYMFLDASLSERAQSGELGWESVPTTALIPAFVISELKTAFIIGFQIFLPFVIIDMLVSSVLVSMGMLMLPPVMISLPLKLLMFILADGWSLVTGTLMASFG